MPSIQDILNVLPGYQAEKQDFNRRMNQSGLDTANEMLLKSIQAVGTGIPAGEPLMLSAGETPKIGSVSPSAAPRSSEGYSLSQNIAPPQPANADPAAGTPFHYKIYNDGEELGYAHGTVKGNTATVNNIYTHEDNSLGVQGLKQLREHVRQDFPAVKNFEGYRVGGARWGQAADPNNRDSFASIKIPALLGALLGYGAANKSGQQ